MCERNEVGRKNRATIYKYSVHVLTKYLLQCHDIVYIVLSLFLKHIKKTSVGGKGGGGGGGISGL